MSHSSIRYRRPGRRPRRPRWWLVLVPALWSILATSALAGELRGHLGVLDTLMANDLASFNDLLRARNVPNIVVRTR